MCNAHNLVVYCRNLFREDMKQYMFSFSLVEITQCKRRMLMYSLAAKMILDGEY